MYYSYNTGGKQLDEKQKTNIPDFRSSKTLPVIWEPLDIRLYYLAEHTVNE